MGRKKRDTQSGYSLPHTEYVQQLRDMLAEHGTAIKAKNAIEKAKESFGKDVTASTFKITLTYARMYLIEGGVMDGSKHGYWQLAENGKDMPLDDAFWNRVIEAERLKAEKKATDEAKEAAKQKKIQAADTENALPDTYQSQTRYWLFSVGEDESRWKEKFFEEKVVAIGPNGWDELGDLRSYASQKSIRKKMQELQDMDGVVDSCLTKSLIAWEFSKTMTVGDVVFAHCGSTILAMGSIDSDYIYDDKRQVYKHYRKVSWTENGRHLSPESLSKRTLTEITHKTGLVDSLLDFFSAVADDPDRHPLKMWEEYSPAQFHEEVFMDEKKYQPLVNLLLKKKNIILQGAPGVGKTFMAQRLAYSIIGEKNKDQVEMIQFHQSYSYEDFIMGYRPTENGFKLEPGPFYKFCMERARLDPENEYFFIIDEINRGNLSKIFGELFMLIENDKRGSELRLLYSDEKFSVPENVYIIGMMNTADRSLAMMDYALRRRFAFYELEPGFDSQGFKQYAKKIKNEKFKELIKTVQELNRDIEKDDTLGSGFRVGHSYFVLNKPKAEPDSWYDKQVTDEWISSVVEYELIPLLQEYWFDNRLKRNEWIAKLSAFCQKPEPADSQTADAAAEQNEAAE